MDRRQFLTARPRLRLARPCSPRRGARRRTAAPSNPVSPCPCRRSLRASGSQPGLPQGGRGPGQQELLDLEPDQPGQRASDSAVPGRPSWKAAARRSSRNALSLRRTACSTSRPHSRTSLPSTARPARSSGRASGGSGTTNMRGVALGQGLVFSTSGANIAYALDQRPERWSGRRRCSTKPQRGLQHGTLAGAIVYYDGLIYIGMRAASSARAATRYASDAATGKIVWTFWSCPGPGEYGNDTWAGTSWQSRRCGQLGPSSHRPRSRARVLGVW